MGSKKWFIKDAWQSNLIKKISDIPEQEMPLFYYNKQVGTRRVDFIVDDLIMLELKALIKLEDVHLAQGINYLKAYNLETGLLINFGSPSMEFKRLFRK